MNKKVGANTEVSEPTVVSNGAATENRTRN